MVAYFHCRGYPRAGPGAHGATTCCWRCAAMASGGRAARCTPLGPEGMLRVGSRFGSAMGRCAGRPRCVRLDPDRRLELRYADGDLVGPVALGARCRRRRHAGALRATAACGRTAPSPSARWPTGPACAGTAAIAQVAALAGHAARPRGRRGRPQRRRSVRGAAQPVGGAPLPARSDLRRQSLREILAAATRAPSARNAQPWAFVAVRDAGAEGRDPPPLPRRLAPGAGVHGAGRCRRRHQAPPDYARMMRGVDALAERARPRAGARPLLPRHRAARPDGRRERPHPRTAVGVRLDLSRRAEPHARRPRPRHRLDAHDARARSSRPTCAASSACPTTSTSRRWSRSAIRAGRFASPRASPLEEVAFLDRWGNPLPA